MIRRTVFVCALSALVACGPAKPVKFGAVLPITGEAAIYGLPIQKGIELAFAKLTDPQSQSTTPYPLELEVVDSASDPDQARRQLAALYGGGVLAALGGVTTAEALQMVPVADKYDRILLSPSASTPELTGISKNFYRVFPSDAREGATMGNFATIKLKVKNVVILAKAGPYAKGVQQIFQTEFERYGGEVLELIEFPASSSDFSGLVERVLTLKPEAVYLAAYANDSAQMIRELHGGGFGGKIFTTSAFAAPEIVEQVGRPAEGVFLTQAVFEVESDEPAIKDFVDAFRKEYGLAPDLYSAHGYDSMMVLAEALRKARGRTSSEFWKGMRSIRDFAGATGTIQFDERGDVQKFPRVYVVNNGMLVDYEAEVEVRRRRLLDQLRRLEEERRKRGTSSG